MKNTLVTNFQKDTLANYKGAIVIYQLITGYGTLSIEKDAYDSFGDLLPEHHSLHVSERHDLSKFWEIFNQLKTI